MTEVEIIDAINKKRAELEKKKGQNADGTVLTAIEKEIEELTMSLQPVEKSRDQKAFLDECAGQLTDKVLRKEGLVIQSLFLFQSMITYL